MSRTRVLILGSKPGASVPRADYTYCANCASWYYADALAANRPLVNIVSSSIVAPPHKRQKPDNVARHRKQYGMILEALPETLVIVHSRPTPLPYLEVETCFREDGYHFEIRHITYDNHRRLIYQHTGLQTPVKPYNLPNLPLRYSIHYFRDRVRAPLQRSRRTRAQCKNAFRLSTGIFTLIYALNTHGIHADYVVSGIGLRDRNQYLDGHSLKGGRMTPHVHADDRAIRALTGQYSITTTEPELTDLLSLHSGSV